MLITAVAFTVGCTKEGNKDVKVTTNEPQNITQTSATISGEVEVVADDITITEKGVCWGTSKNPTVSDNHMASDGRGVTVTCTITGLEPGTTYHVRVYAFDGSEYYYGTDQSFRTESNSGGGGTGGNGTFNGHDYVDLGLPSGTLWAKCNVGANSPEEYGDYFAWGETQPKSRYRWSNYKYGDDYHLTKYCNNSNYGNFGFTDNLAVLQPSDDAATVNWGTGWCMPTKEQWKELLDNVTNRSSILDGVKGWLFIASNGNSLFLPSGGNYYYNDNLGVEKHGDYWSSSLASEPDYAMTLFFEDNCRVVGYERYRGRSVRPVRSAR